MNSTICASSAGMPRAVVLANRRDGRLRHAELARSARLGAPHVDGVELAGDGHRGEHPHAHVERALEADEGAEVGQTAGQLRAVQEHRERALQRPAALDDAVHDRVVLGGHLVLAGDRRQPCHGRDPPRSARIPRRVAV